MIPESVHTTLPYLNAGIQAFTGRQYHWYALYTRPHHEKKACALLEWAKIETFLPLQTTLRQRSDRKKKVILPLFSCYLFVHITAKDYFRALNIPGIVRYVTFEGKAVPVPENQIQLIKNFLVQNIELEEVTCRLDPGAQVEIVSGPLTGLTGELIHYKNSTRVIMRIEEINKALLVNIPLNYLRKIA